MDLFSPAVSEPIVLFWFLVIYVHSLLAMHPSGRGNRQCVWGHSRITQDQEAGSRIDPAGGLGKCWRERKKQSGMSVELHNPKLSQGSARARKRAGCPRSNFSASLERRRREEGSCRRSQGEPALKDNVDNFNKLHVLWNDQVLSEPHSEKPMLTIGGGCPV